MEVSRILGQTLVRLSRLLHDSRSSRFYIDMSLFTCVAIDCSFSTFTVLGKEAVSRGGQTARAVSSTTWYCDLYPKTGVNCELTVVAA